jgi:protein TonB
MLQRVLSVALLCLALVPLHAAKTQPQLVDGKPPAYPEALKKAGVTGEAKILTQIDATGAVTEATVSSATHAEFGVAALAAVKSWRFKPATEDGQPVATKAIIPFPFRLGMKDQISAELGRDVWIDESKLTEKIYGWAELQKWINFRQKNANRVPYPEELKGSGISEEVAVTCLISPEGFVLNPTLTDGIKNQQLIVPVMKHIAKVRFEAPVFEGKRVYARQKIKLLCSEDPNFGAKPAKN